MQERLISAILTAYHKAKPHLMDEISDNQEVMLLARYRLGDLRELDRQQHQEKPHGG